MPILKYRNIEPKLAQGVYLADSAYVIGDVELGQDCGIWFNVTIRGDVNYIRIGQRTNIQDGSTVHVTRVTHPTVIGAEVTVGHNAVIHGCTIGDQCLIGMGAVIMDGAVIGEHSIIGAGALIPPGKTIPPKSLVVGSPGKVMRQLHAKELEFLHESAENYIQLKNEYRTDQ